MEFLDSMFFFYRRSAEETGKGAGETRSSAGEVEGSAKETQADTGKAEDSTREEFRSIVRESVGRSAREA